MQTKSEKILSFLCMGAFVIFFAVSVSFCFSKPQKSRFLFYFPSYDSKNLCTEVRFLPNKPVQGVEKQFVEELILGPMTNRYIRVFPRDTELSYCFLKDKVLYVGLSDAVLSGVDGLTIKESIDIFRVNIVKNFTFINKIDVSSDGKSVFEQ